MLLLLLMLQLCLLYLQLQHEISQIKQPHGRLFEIEAILEKLQLFCEKPPKGFEKYFKTSKGSATDAVDSKKTESKISESKLTKPSVSTPPGGDMKSKSSNDWNFGMFGKTSSGSSGNTGSGRPIGGGDGNDREKWLLLGAIGVVALIGSLTFLEIGYKEIGWKEFVNK